MSTKSLQTKALELAKSDDPTSVDEYNHVLDILERRLQADDFFTFCANIFGEA